MSRKGPRLGPWTPILPAGDWALLRPKELWDYRELIYFLAWRDLKVRYRQTILGILWVILQPVLMMGIFTLVFDRLIGVSSEGAPYPLFVLTGLVPWTLFSSALAQSSISVVASQNLIKKVYFPRLVIPLSTVFSSVVDFVVSLGVLLTLMAVYGMPLTERLVWLFPLGLLAISAALAVGIWLSALHVQYRDVQYAVPFLTQVLLFATPIAYPTTLVPPGWRSIMALNPLTGVVEGFRWVLLGINEPPGGVVMISALATLLLLASGLLYFLHVEPSFADVV